jgi:acetyl-CoA carboxylase biotin carboxyl carrier protein
MSKKPLSKSDKKQEASSRAGGSIDLQRLEQVLSLMSKHHLAELEWEDAQIRLHLKSQGANPGLAPQPVMAPLVSAAPQVVQAKADAPAPAAPSGGLAPNQKKITSPFVGTFYRSASPTAEPYVKEGKQVKRGDTLCIIEAMKLMNEIEAETSGTIVSILIENGQPVEFGEPLFIIQV